MALKIILTIIFADSFTKDFNCSSKSTKEFFPPMGAYDAIFLKDLQNAEAYLEPSQTSIVELFCAFIR